MAFQFPPGPTVGQTFTPVAGVTYRWSGTAWHLLAGPGAFITQADADTRYVNVDEAQNTTNRIINGKMAIDQRNAGATVTPPIGAYMLDRWQLAITVASSITISRPSLTPGSYYLSLRTAVANPTPLSAAEHSIKQLIEGLNVADLALGTANASAFTLAFEVRSTITGTGTVSARGGTPLMSYVASFPVTTNFTTVTVVIPPVTTSVWEGGAAGFGVVIDFTMGSGSTYFAPNANTWLTGNFTTLSTATNWMAVVGTELHIRNVRLYKGSVDFGPDRRLYAEELALCQRYYQKSFRQATAPVTNAGVNTGEVQFNNISAGAVGAAYFVSLKTTMRANPAVTLYSPATASNQINAFGVGDWSASVATGNVSETGFTLSGTQPAGATVNGFNLVHWTASAEL